MYNHFLFLTVLKKLLAKVSAVMVKRMRAKKDTCVGLSVETSTSELYLFGV